MSPSFVLPFQRVWRSCTNTREAKQVSSTDGGINLGSKNSPRRVSYPEEIKICIIWSWPNLRDGVLHVVRMLLCVDVRTFLLHNVQNHAHFANEWKLPFGKTRLQVWALTGPVSLGVDQGRWQQYPHCFSPRFSSRTRTTELPGAGHHVLTKHSGQRCCHLDSWGRPRNGPEQERNIEENMTKGAFLSIICPIMLGPQKGLHVPLSRLLETNAPSFCDTPVSHPWYVRYSWFGHHFLVGETQIV